MKEEIWVPVMGFEKRFKISSHGRLLSIGGKYGGETILHPHKDTQGYFQATLRMKPLKRKVRIHTLVAEHFLVKPSYDRPTVNHKDGDKLNNRIENLEWITAAENLKHAVASGLHNTKGSNHPHAKLTEADVLEIRRLRKAGWLHKDLAIKFGITRRQVGDVVNGVNWGWLIETAA